MTRAVLFLSAVICAICGKIPDVIAKRDALEFIPHRSTDLLMVSVSSGGKHHTRIGAADSSLFASHAWAPNLPTRIAVAGLR